MPPEAQPTASNARLVRARLLDFLKRAGYELAKVKAKPQGTHIMVDIDEGRVDKVIVLGQTPFKALFPNEDPIGKTVRLGAERYTVIGVFDKRPSVGGMNGGQDDFVAIPYTNYLKQFGIRSFAISSAPLYLNHEMM